MKHIGFSTGEMRTTRKPAREKLHGIHYTPEALANAVAERLVSHCQPPIAGSLTVSDPACGDGALLEAFYRAAQARGISVRLFGSDLDADAIAQTAERLDGISEVHLEQRDFLAGKGANADLFGTASTDPSADVFIANPPYVRTQVLGGEQAKELASRFSLRGRVDLAYAFCMAMVDELPDGGLFAFIISNKFLTIKAGESLRDYLRDQTEILEVWDLGDSKLFSAAVLPCVIFGRRAPGAFRDGAPFRSVYTSRNATSTSNATECTTEEQFLTHFKSATRGLLAWRGEILELREGSLQSKPSDGTWMLRDKAVAGVQSHMAVSKARHFGDVLKVKVGIKTTADSVYIRDDWDALPEEVRPEAELLWPIRLTADVARWVPPAADSLSHRTLYPFERHSRKRVPVDLDAYPRARAYFELHRQQLEGRRYVIEGGRHWWEPWVPHQPSMWQHPRVIFPEISEKPVFSVDKSGVIPNGSLFWMHSAAPGETEVVRAACAIANSSFAVAYYDMLLGTRLYAGRRRWNKQHVDQLPFPNRDADISALAELYLEAATASRGGQGLEAVEREIDRLCRALFAGS